MRNITLIMSAALLLMMPCIALSQEMTALEDTSGFRASKNSGMVSKLLRWQKFGVKSGDGRTFNPQQKLMDQLGIRQSATVMATPPSNYEFYGGESYKGNNVPYASITDEDGNTYITGASTSETQPAGDMLTMKVGPTGTVLWQARRSAAKYAVEYGLKLLLDKDGNLVVTGLKWNGNDMDIQVVKYNPAGTEVWSSLFNSTFQGLDIPSAMTAGTDGSIYITGLSWSGNSIDYLTLKYNADGSLAWQVRESAGAETWSEPTAIAVDNAGNVVVTGYSPNTEGWLNYHTVKYDVNGQELWSQAYNYASTDPGDPAPVTNSTPRAIAIDENNNIYVSGTFDTFIGRIGTIKYTAAGVQQWVNSYKSGTEITLGFQAGISNSVLYVAGSRIGEFADDGNVLISYNLDGTQNWIQETTDLIEAVNAELLFDAAGNPVVAAKGMTQGAEEWMLDNAARAKKYSPAGELLGQAAFVVSSPEGLASMGELAGIGLDADGNVYMAVNTYYTAVGAVYEVIKSGFAPLSPVPAWNTSYTNLGSPAASMLNSFADGSGNTLSTGSYSGFEDGMLLDTYFITKHNANGAIAWEKTYNAANGNAAGGIVGTADAEGNIYVCLLPQFDGTLTVKKLSPAGTELWEHEVLLYNPQVYVMQCGPTGTLYLGGVAFEEENAETASFVAIKLDAAGNELWKSFTASDNAEHNIYGISSGKVNAGGDFILTGSYGTGSMMSQNVNLALLKFNNDGSTAWMNPVAIAGSSSSGTDLLIAADGFIYVNGFAQDNETGLEDIVTVKFNADGSEAWVQTFGDAENKERSYTIRQFSNGDVAVVGYSLAPNEDIHNKLIKYNSSGVQQWVYTSDVLHFYNDFHIDGSDVCYIMDQVITDPFPHKILGYDFPIASIIKVDAEGNGEEEFFVGQEYAEFYGKRLIPHADDRLLLGGSIANQGFFEGLYYFETEHDGTLSVADNEYNKQANHLGQNHPNPAVHTTSIPFNLVDGGTASIKLYNSQGRFIKELVNEEFSPGQYTVAADITGLSSGIYFYQLTCGKFKQARKMVIK